MLELPKYYGKSAFDDALWAGNLGVDLFFAISGFIIVAVSLQPRSLAPRILPLEFLRRRFARIIPVMWIAIISYAAFRYLGRGGEDHMDSYLRALLLWPSGPLEPGQIWTLRQEWLFYLLFALTTLVWPLRPVLYGWFLLPLFLWSIGALPEAANVPATLLGVITHASSVQFGVGALVGFVYLRHPERFTAQPIPFGFPLLIALTCVLFAIGSLFHLERSPPEAVVTGAISAVILVVALFVRPSSARFSKLGAVLGAASYSIYLFHPGLISAQLGISSKLAPSAPVEVILVSISIATIFCCVMIYYFVERPILQLFRGKPRAPLAAANSAAH